MKCHFELAHVGINLPNGEEARETAETFGRAFNLDIREGKTSFFAGRAVECMKAPYRGTLGHLALTTEDVEAAVKELEEKGYSADLTTAAYTESGALRNIYLQEEMGGFAVHILLKEKERR